MDSPEYNSPTFDPESLKLATQRLDPSIAFAPNDDIDELMTMQPKGLSLADVWMIRAAGITKDELNTIVSQGFTISKGRPPAALLPGLLTDHDLQLLEETGFDVQPIRKLMMLGYSVVFVDEPAPIPQQASTVPTTVEPSPSTVDAMIDKLDKLGFDIQSLKALLDNGFALVPSQEGSKIDMGLPLEPGLVDQLDQDGYTLTTYTRRESDLPDIGPPSGSAQKQVAQDHSANIASLTSQADHLIYNPHDDIRSAAAGQTQQSAIRAAAARRPAARETAPNPRYRSYNGGQESAYQPGQSGPAYGGAGGVGGAFLTVSENSLIQTCRKPSLALTPGNLP